MDAFEIAVDILPGNKYEMSYKLIILYPLMYKFIDWLVLMVCWPRVILCLEVWELCSLYIYIYIICVVS